MTTKIKNRERTKDNLEDDNTFLRLKTFLLRQVVLYNLRVFTSRYSADIFSFYYKRNLRSKLLSPDILHLTIDIR